MEKEIFDYLNKLDENSIIILTVFLLYTILAILSITYQIIKAIIKGIFTIISLIYLKIKKINL